jgi:hypothetical protein
VPERPALSDHAIADRIQQRIERFAPGFPDPVLARDMRSPERLERENPSLVGGDDVWRSLPSSRTPRPALDAPSRRACRPAQRWCGDAWRGHAFDIVDAAACPRCRQVHGRALAWLRRLGLAGRRRRYNDGVDVFATDALTLIV